MHIGFDITYTEILSAIALLEAAELLGFLQCPHFGPVGT
jgi:hypothetical protein